MLQINRRRSLRNLQWKLAEKIETCSPSLGLGLSGVIHYCSLQTTTARQVFNKICLFWPHLIGNEPNFILTECSLCACMKTSHSSFGPIHQSMYICVSIYRVDQKLVHLGSHQNSFLQFPQRTLIFQKNCLT